ncbi:S8 family serine peptidase [Natronomonas salina]|uniref:S8 family serine peptidase n=1 Tax=Natronomonas salina TaxID=1710540 RepID=UPI0015B5719E|nr:S8 family serine peptidase [Natronomonas salina]QLD88351.1 S8 family serine peptidase [Natronomonas salina]
MLPGGPDCRHVASVLLAAVLMVSCFGTGIGFAAAGGTADRPTPTHGGTAPESDAVHPDLHDATGEVTVVVRFPELGNDRAQTRSNRETGMRMRSHATNSQAAFDEFVADHDGVTVVRSFWVANAKLVTVDTDAVQLAELAAVEDVREIHPNYRMEATSTVAPAPSTGSLSSSLSASDSTDHDYATTYGVEQIRAPDVWERFGTKGGNVSVAVLDTGVEPSHPDVDVPPERWAEFDEDGNRVDSKPYDSAEHGTHTSGTVAGGNASGEYIGVAPEATLYHGKVLHEGSGTWAGATAGIEWAATEAGVDIISMSLSGPNNPSLVEPIRQANDLGVIVVASAGNDGAGTSGSPGNLYDSIAVGAVDSNREVAGFSGGERIDTSETWTDPPEDWPAEYVVPNVAAPGRSVTSAAPDGGYRDMSGTSMAAPHVAGTVALVRAAGGDHLTQAEMRDLLERSADHPAGGGDELDTRYGAGVVDAYEATARGASDSTVTGQVVDGSGTPVSESRVDTEFDYGTATDVDGTYGLDVPSLDQTLTVDAFGFAPQTFTVAPNSETLEKDLELTQPVLAARAETAPPERVDPGETVTHEFAVSNVSAVTVDRVGDSTIEQGNVTLRIEGETVAFGERLNFTEPQINTPLTVEVETTAETVAALELAYTFEDGTDSLTRSTPPTYVHHDPMEIPTHYDPDDLQSALDVAAPNTTVAVDGASSGPYVLPVDGTDSTASGLSIPRPVTLRSAGEAPLELAVADFDGAETSVVGIDVLAPGVDLRGIDLDASGAGVGLGTVDGTTVADTSVSNATLAYEFRGDAHARNVSLGDGRRLDVDATDVALSPTAAPAPAPEHHERIGPAVAAEPLGSDAAASLSVDYAAGDGTRLQNETLGLWRYDESSGEWSPVDGSSVDAATGRIAGTLDPFGTVAPMGEQHPAEFVLEDVRTQTDVVAGQELTVEATVANRGVKIATQDVDLTFDGDVVASRTVTLEEGETRQVAFAHAVDETRSGGVVSHGVGTADDSYVTDVRVDEPARFDVSGLDAPSAVERADPLLVSATVANTGDLSEEQRLELRLGADLDGDAAVGDYAVLASTNRTLAAGNATVVSFSADVPRDADTGVLEIGVFSEDADARASIDVSRINGTLEGSVADATTDEPLAGVTVTATDRETGEPFTTTTDADGTYGLRLPVGDYSVGATADGYDAVRETDVAVADGEATAVDLDLEQSARFFAVGGLGVPPSAAVGDSFEVTATVENLGNSAGERTVELVVDGRTIDQRTVRLDAGANGTVVFAHAADASGPLEVVVRSPDASTAATVDIAAAEDGEDADSGGSTGGGGSSGGGSSGGGGGAAPAPPAPPAPPAEEETTPEEPIDDGVNESDATPAGLAESADIVDSDPDRAGVSVPVRNTSVSEITFQDDDAAGRVTVSEGVVDDLPATPGRSVVQLSIEVPAALADRPATVRSTVDPATVGDGGVTMYRYADGEWQPLETTVTTADDGRVLVTAETPGFSRFALVENEARSTPAESRSVPDDTPSPTPTATGTQAPTDTSTVSGTASPTEDDGAGFGVVAALLAVLAGLFAARRSAR